MAKKSEYILVSNIPDGGRESEYSWGRWTETLSKPHLEQAKAYLKSGRIKWYCGYKRTFDYTEGMVSMEVVVHDAVEEIPPKEFNVAAKGYKPPFKPSLKKAAAEVYANFNFNYDPPQL